MATSQATITYLRADNVFNVGSFSRAKRTSEDKLRAIGDQDINDTIERALAHPYKPQSIHFHQHRVRFA